MNLPKPCLVIISGPPAAGKTTMARPFADALHYPLFSMDDIKEQMADAIGPAAKDIADHLGDAAVNQVLHIAQELIHQGTCVVVEGFFQADAYSADFAKLAESANAVLVHVFADDAVLKRRYETRALAAGRHWIHGDIENLPHMTPELPEFLAKQLELNVPTIELDTTNREVDVGVLAAQVRQLLHGSVA